MTGRDSPHKVDSEEAVFVSECAAFVPYSRSGSGSRVGAKAEEIGEVSRLRRLGFVLVLSYALRIPSPYGLG